MEENKKETALEEQLDINTKLLVEIFKHVYQLEQFIYSQSQVGHYQGKIKSL